MSHLRHVAVLSKVVCLHAHAGERGCERKPNARDNRCVSLRTNCGAAVVAQSTIAKCCGAGTPPSVPSRTRREADRQRSCTAALFLLRLTLILWAIGLSLAPAHPPYPSRAGANAVSTEVLAPVLGFPGNWTDGGANPGPAKRHRERGPWSHAGTLVAPANCRRAILGTVLTIAGLATALAQHGGHSSRQGARRPPAREGRPGTRPVERLPCDFDGLDVLRFSLVPS
jgi:hypothetical protein